MPSFIRTSTLLLLAAFCLAPQPSNAQQVDRSTRDERPADAIVEEPLVNQGVIPVEVRQDANGNWTL